VTASYAAIAAALRAILRADQSVTPAERIRLIVLFLNPIIHPFPLL